MNIKWFDERTASSPQIKHHFQMTTTYGGSPVMDSRDKYTTGGMPWPQTDNFYIDVPGVTRNTNIWIIYSVSVIHVQSGVVLCSVDNSGEWPQVTFYLN